MPRSVGETAGVEAINILKGAGTHEVLELSGRIAGETQKIIPTRQEAEKLIAAAGGRITRTERAHKGLGHAYPHINYYLDGDPKKPATVRVQGMGRHFYRGPKKKIGPD